MEQETRRTFPYIAERVWSDLRRQFRQAPPRGAVDGEYLATVLNIDLRSARNIAPNLRRLGLVDDEGRATERAMAWRDNGGYREATTAMAAEVYPTSLLDAVPGPTPDVEAARRWFARETRSGEANARRLASFYALLIRGDPSGIEAEHATRSDSATHARASRQKPVARDRVVERSHQGSLRRGDRSRPTLGLHFHLASDIGDEQLAKIFAYVDRYLGDVMRDQEGSI
jgi:hypothetical protein